METTTSSKNNNTIINNYYFLTSEDIKEMINSACLFQPIRNYSTKSFKTQIKQGPKNKIIITEGKTKDTDLEINNDKTHKNYEDNTTFETINDIAIEINNSEKKKVSPIFKIKKRYFEIDNKKKTGRKSKNSTKESIHTKYCHDNILRKIKVKFLHKIIKYINRIILKNYNHKLRILKPLKGIIAQNNTINFNKHLLHLKLKELFSNYEINGKFKLLKKIIIKISLIKYMMKILKN